MHRDKDSKRKARRPQFEAQPRRLQPRARLQRRPSEAGDDGVAAAAHGDEAGDDEHAPLPREDRAG